MNHAVMNILDIHAVMDILIKIAKYVNMAKCLLPTNGRTQRWNIGALKSRGIHNQPSRARRALSKGKSISKTTYLFRL